MSTPRRFSTLGGHPALDFANTVTWRLDPGRRRDHRFGLRRGTALSGAARRAQLCRTRRTSSTRRSASPDLAASEFEELKRLREAVYGVVIDEADAPHELSRHFADAIAAATLTRGDSALHWTLPVDVRLPRLRMAQLAVELVTRESVGPTAAVRRRRVRLGVPGSLTATQSPLVRLRGLRQSQSRARPLRAGAAEHVLMTGVPAARVARAQGRGRPNRNRR